MGAKSAVIRFALALVALPYGPCIATAAPDDEEELAAQEGKEGVLVAAPAAAVQWNVVLQNDAMGRQFQAQFRPILSAELSFIRHYCDVPKEKRPKIKAAGEAALKDAARQFVDLQQGQRVNAAAANGNAQPQPYPPRIIHDAIVKALKDTLAPDQFARYMDESTRRTESRKRAAVLWAVSRLDATLFLTAEQREEIAASIASNWQDNWEQWLVAGYGEEYFPAIPRKVVAPLLKEEQKLVWRKLQKVDFGFNGSGWAVAAENDGFWGDEPKEAAAPAVDGVIFTGNLIIE